MGLQLCVKSHGFEVINGEWYDLTWLKCENQLLTSLGRNELNAETEKIMVMLVFPGHLTGNKSRK